MEHTAVNGSVHTSCKQHQRVCTQICVQICLRVLCEWGIKLLTSEVIKKTANFTKVALLMEAVNVLTGNMQKIPRTKEVHLWLRNNLTQVGWGHFVRAIYINFSTKFWTNLFPNKQVFLVRESMGVPSFRSKQLIPWTMLERRSKTDRKRCHIFDMWEKWNILNQNVHVVSLLICSYEIRQTGPGGGGGGNTQK